MTEKIKKNSGYVEHDSKNWEYDFGSSTELTGEIADKEIEAVLDDIFDEAMGTED